MEQYLEILRRYWGYNEFRPLQPEIIMSIGQGHDTLGLMPTGGGKSLTFQVPALAKKGTCLVITPLIALMKDQVQNLRKRGILAAALYSGMTHDEINVALDNCILGECKFLYVSPERLSSEQFLVKLSQMEVSILVVDEAHCISQWGYDFRPSYMKIADIRTELPDVPVLALTATATPKVVDDIMSRLKFAKPNVFKKSFARKNIAYMVRKCENKETQMITILGKVSGSALVYVRNRKRTREYAEFLLRNGISAAYFHAGLSTREKDAIQAAWTENKIRVIVCTNAFGMGIDKPDVRLVIHMDAPDSLEAYFQEAGRAGRDEKPAYAVFLWSEADKAKLRKTIANSYPPKEEILSVYNKLAYMYSIGVNSGAGTMVEFNMGEFCSAYKKSMLTTHYALNILANAGYIDYQEEAEFSSRLIFIMQRHELYNVQMAYPELDVIIKVILRSYTGLFMEYAVIDENIIAQRCNITRQEVYERLKELARMRVLLYNPQKRCSYIVWTVDREDDRYFHIPREVYDDRKSDAEDRVNSVIEYCERDDKCRSRLLLRYFGEKSSSSCGHCDVCLNKKRRSGLDTVTFETIEKELRALLSDGPQSYEAICAMPYSSAEIDMVLRWLTDYGFVYMSPQGEYMLANRDDKARP